MSKDRTEFFCVAVVACDEPTDVVRNCGRTGFSIVCTLGESE
jgi:hypothetical protein